MDEDNKKTGAFLKLLRKEKGITQEQLAEYFDVSERTINRWENGVTSLKLSNVIKLAAFYGVTELEILNGERNKAGLDAKEELRETVIRVAELTEEEKVNIKKSVHKMFVVGLIAELIFVFLFYSGNALNEIGSSCIGITFCAMIFGVIMTNSTFEINLPKYRMRVRERKALRDARR